MKKKYGMILKDCIADIERELGIRNSHITECCKNKIKSAGKFKWRYANE